MTSSEEARRWIRDAEDSAIRAKERLQLSDFRGTIQAAQMAIEGSAKAIIACFGLPEWDHDPSKQLTDIIDSRLETIKREFSEYEIDALRTLSNDASESAPWHGRSVYGEMLPSGEHVPAITLCTQEIAQEMVERAERSFSTARDFVRKWFI